MRSDLRIDKAILASDRSLEAFFDVLEDLEEIVHPKGTIFYLGVLNNQTLLLYDLTGLDILGILLHVERIKNFFNVGEIVIEYPKLGKDLAIYCSFGQTITWYCKLKPQDLIENGQTAS